MNVGKKAKLHLISLDNVPNMGHSVDQKDRWFSVIIYGPAQKEIQTWPVEAKKDLGSIITLLQKGKSVGPPDTKPMKSISSGCFEVRLKGADGTYRVFYILKDEIGILIFHSFKKQSQKTPIKEIQTGKIRLKKFLKELSDEYKIEKE